MKFAKIYFQVILFLFSGVAFPQNTNCSPDGLGGFRCSTEPSIDQLLGGGRGGVDLNAYQRGADLANQQNMMDLQRQQLLMQQQQLMR